MCVAYSAGPGKDMWLAPLKTAMYFSVQQKWGTPFTNLRKYQFLKKNIVCIIIVVIIITYP